MLSAEFVDLFFYGMQQFGMALGVGAVTVALAFSAHGQRKDSPVHIVHRVARLALWLIVISGAAITAAHSLAGESATIFEGAYIFKWILIVAVFFLSFLGHTDDHENLAQTIRTAVWGGTWYGLFALHMLAPEVSLGQLFISYAAWMAIFIGGFVLTSTLEQRRSGRSLAASVVRTAVQNSPVMPQKNMEGITLPPKPFPVAPTMPQPIKPTGPLPIVSRPTPPTVSAPTPKPATAPVPPMPAMSVPAPKPVIPPRMNVQIPSAKPAQTAPTPSQPQQTMAPVVHPSVPAIKPIVPPPTPFHAAPKPAIPVPPMPPAAVSPMSPRPMTPVPPPVKPAAPVQAPAPHPLRPVLQPVSPQPVAPKPPVTPAPQPRLTPVSAPVRPAPQPPVNLPTAAASTPKPPITEEVKITTREVKPSLFSRIFGSTPKPLAVQPSITISPILQPKVAAPTQVAPMPQAPSIPKPPTPAMAPGEKVDLSHVHVMPKNPQDLQNR